MIQELRFVRMNTDVAGHDLKPEEGEYRMMENLAPAQRGRGMGFVRESLRGTEQIPNLDYEWPTLGGVTLATYEDKPTRKTYSFVWVSSDFHRIMVYDSDTKTYERVVRSNQFPWTPTTQISSIRILDDVIYWCDPIPSFYKLQDDTQKIEIDYVVRGIEGAISVDFLFQATAIDISGGSVNFSTTVTGIKTADQVAVEVANALNADPSFTAIFSATLDTGSRIIKIKALTHEGNWVFTNNYEPYFFFYSTNYDPVPNSPEAFHLYPVAPKDRPTVEGVVDWPSLTGGDFITNQIIGRNWQFCFRQIYTNDQISVFGPYSQFYESAKRPDDTLNTSLPNKLKVEFTINRPDLTKEVELAARTSDTGDWFIIKTFTRSELFSGSGKIEYITEGTEQQIPVAAADAIKQQEGTPRESSDLELIKNKLFLIDSLTGYTFNDAELVLSLIIGEGTSASIPRSLKDAGLYNVGLRFFDQDMRTDGTVHAITQVNVPSGASDDYVETLPANGGGKRDNKRQRLSITVTGRPPIWAHYYCFVRSDELKYGNFIQCVSWVHHYVRPQLEGDTPSSDTDFYYMYGNQYRVQSTITDRDQWNYLHLHLPSNLPFQVKRGMVVRLDSSGGLANLQRFATVLDVKGPMVVIEKPDWDSGSSPFWPETLAAAIEIYEPKQVAETTSFYEASRIYAITDPGTENRDMLAVSLGVGAGVQFVDNEDEQLQWKYDWGDYTTSGSTDEEKGLRKDKYAWSRSETYSPSFSVTEIAERDLSTEEDVFEYDYDFGYVNDQSFATRDLGRPAVLLQNVREEQRLSVIKWSNDYVANAQINGLHTFEPLNEYTLPLERGPITALQKASEDVLLAIHSSAVTSLYIGKGVIRSADLNPTLVTTDSVVGSDNQLKLSFGTVHPESVSEIDGDVYFWDGIRNEPVRYSSNGLTPLATTFATRVFFKDTIPATFGNTSNYRCYTQFDRLLNMIFFTFKNETEGLTIGFHEPSKAWIGKFGFVPEAYGVIGDHFLGYVDGEPWLHNQDDANHNTFYGTLYKSKATFVLNQGGHMEKAWDGIMIDSNYKWDVPSITNNENQKSSLVANDFVWRDQLYYADFLRDENTDPLLLKSGQIALRHGKFLSSQIITLQMELESSEPHYLHAIAVASTLKAGHNLQVQ